MSGQFDKESSVKNFEWHRERAIREVKKGVSSIGANKIDWNLRAVAKKHGEQAA